MYKYAQVIYPMLRVVARSMLFIYARLIWGVADLCWHDTYQRVYIHMSVCKHDEIIGCVKADVRSIC